MVGNFLTIFLIFIVAIYLVLGTSLAVKLAKKTNYEGGFLTLWNLLQLEVFFKKKANIRIENDENKIIYNKLKQLINKFYLFTIPTFFLIFIADIFGV